MAQYSPIKPRKSTTAIPEFEEAVVNQLTNVMIGVFRDNAWMVDMLKDQLEETDHDN